MLNRVSVFFFMLFFCAQKKHELQRGEAFAQGRHLSLVTAAGRTLELDLPGYTMPKTKNASGYFVADDMDAIDLFIGACGSRLPCKRHLQSFGA